MLNILTLFRAHRRVEQFSATAKMFGKSATKTMTVVESTALRESIDNLYNLCMLFYCIQRDSPKDTFRWYDSNFLSINFLPFLGLPVYSVIHTIDGDDVSDVRYLLINDGKIYTGNRDKSIKVFDISDYRLLNTLSQHKDWVNCLTFYNDEQLYSADWKGEVKLWTNSINTASFTAHQLSVYCLAIDFESDTLYTGSGDGTIKAWRCSDHSHGTTGLASLEKSLITTLTGHSGTVWCLRIDDSKLYSGSWNGEIKVWSTKDYRLITTLPGRSHTVRSLTIHDNKLLTGGYDSTIKVRDCIDFNIIATLEGHTGNVTYLSISNDKLYSSSVDKSIKVWDCNTLKLITSLDGHKGMVECIYATNDKLYSAAQDSTIKVWKL